MLPTKGYAVENASALFKPFDFSRRSPKEHDVVIQILYCGICHSDIHQAKNEWKNSMYPMVPGHEIVGKVLQIGGKVKKYRVDDLVGVGCFVDSCRQCENCAHEEQQFCQNHLSATYNSTEQDKKTPTFGGYSSHIVVDEKYVLKISPDVSLAHTAPLLCAGITTYSPLKKHGIGPGHRVGVMGLGGLGHMAVKIAASMGAEVTVFSRSLDKQKDAERLGAKHFVVTKDPQQLNALHNKFDFILNTISAPHDIEVYLNLLKLDGKMVVVGVPELPMQLGAHTLIRQRRQLSGSLIGGIRETQEMLDYCAENNITADVEVIPVQKVQEAYERTLKGDVHYRFVLDLSTL